MSKAVLVIDMPETCSECPLFTDSYDYPMCVATSYSKGYRFNGHTTKMLECPLKELPKKQTRDYPEYDSYITGYDDGWDDCIDEILGE